MGFFPDKDEEANVYERGNVPDVTVELKKGHLVASKGGRSHSLNEIRFDGDLIHVGCLQITPEAWYVLAGRIERLFPVDDRP